MTEIRAIRNAGFYGRFQCKVIQLSEIVIQISGVLLHRKGARDSGLEKNDPVSRMIQLSVS